MASDSAAHTAGENREFTLLALTRIDSDLIFSRLPRSSSQATVCLTDGLRGMFLQRKRYPMTKQKCSSGWFTLALMRVLLLPPSQDYESSRLESKGIRIVVWL